MLEQRLTAAGAALRAAVERANEDREALLDDAERRQTELQEQLDRETTLRGSLEIELGAADAAIAETTSARNALSFRLAEVQAALQHTERRAVADREALVAAGSKREADFEARLTDAASVRHELEQRVAATEAALRDTIERHASEMASASDRLVAERETLVGRPRSGNSISSTTHRRRRRAAHARGEGRGHRSDTRGDGRSSCIGNGVGFRATHASRRGVDVEIADVTAKLAEWSTDWMLRKSPWSRPRSAQADERDAAAREHHGRKQNSTAGWSAGHRPSGTRTDAGRVGSDAARCRRAPYQGNCAV